MWRSTIREESLFKYLYNRSVEIWKKQSPYKQIDDF